MSAIHQEIVLNATPQRLYEAYLDSEEHSRFTANGDADISREVGGAFSCHGGMISGRNIELLPSQRIVQAWRVKNWDEGVYSIVKLEFRAEGSGTRVVLDHAGFPDGHREHLDAGWHTRYWEPWRTYLS